MSTYHQAFLVCFAAIPAILNNQAYIEGIAVFFLIRVISFVIPIYEVSQA